MTMKKFVSCVYPVIFIVGETLTSGVQEWCYDVVGRKKCLLLDTWWQTGKATYSYVTGLVMKWQVL